MWFNIYLWGNKLIINISLQKGLTRTYFNKLIYGGNSSVNMLFVISNCKLLNMAVTTECCM